MHLAAAIRSAVELPVFTLGQITDPAQAERILANGEADMVGMTRARIADPNLVAKLREGRVDDIRPCVGAIVCICNGLSGHSIGTNRVPLYRRLYEHSVTMLPNTDIARVDPGGVVVRNVYTGRESTISGIARVVVSDAPEACDALADVLRQDGRRVIMAGDAVSPREVDVAMAEGALAAREL